MPFNQSPTVHRRHRMTVYQIWSTIDAKNGIDKVLHVVVRKILTHVSKAMGETLPPEAGAFKSFELTTQAGRCECVADEERSIWSLRYKYLDESNLFWYYDIAMIEEDGELLFGLKVDTSSKIDLFEAQKHIPLVDDLLRNCPLMQVRPVLNNSWTIDDPDNLDPLYDFLVSPHRSLPVILLSETNWKTWSYTPQAPTYVVSSEYLAPRVLGYAFVVRLSFRASYAWKRRVGNSWAAFDGACRIYYPNVDFENGIPHHHICYFKDKIWYWNQGEQRGKYAFTDYLIEKVKIVASTTYTVRKGLYFVPDARILVAELDLTRATQEANAPEREKAQRRQIEALKSKLDSAEEENNDWLDELDRMRETIEYYKQQNATLRSQIDALRSHLSRQTTQPIEQPEEAFPSTLEELPEWVKNNLAGQLVLLPRAERSVTKSDYAEPEMVYRALEILAHEYRDSRLGLGDDIAWKTAFQNDRMELSGSIEESLAGKYGDEYYVNFPPGSDEKHFLRFHIERGNSRETRNCMRVYFFWDEETQQVVVGWLPSHLRNRMS